MQNAEKRPSDEETPLLLLIHDFIELIEIGGI
jgi:hypothetical protein